MRADDYNSAEEINAGDFVFVQKGDNAGQGYILGALPESFELGVNNLNFSRFTIDTTLPVVFDSQIEARELRVQGPGGSVNFDGSNNYINGSLYVNGYRANFESVDEMLVPTPDQDNEATNKAYVDAAVATNTSALAVETSARAAAITALQADIDQNESDADAAITAEATTARAAEQANTAAIATEVTRAEAAEAALQADIDQNESDADAAIADLQTESALRSEKEPVAYVYNTNQYMSSPTYELGSDQRILLIGQTNPSQNGIYTWQEDNSQGPEVAYSLVRTQDFDETSEMQAGAFVFATSGDSSGKGYVLTQSVYTLNQSHINFKRFTYDQEIDAFDTKTLSSKAPVQDVREANLSLQNAYQYGDFYTSIYDRSFCRRR